MTPVGDFIVLYLMYFIVPLWLLAGFADWVCHRLTDIEHNSGVAETAFHLVMLVEMGIPALMVLLLEVNLLVLLVAVVAFVLHEISALWDVSYAVDRRRVTPVEQHIHSFLELVPLLAISCLLFLHLDQLDRVMHGSFAAVDWQLRSKERPLPPGYVFGVLCAIALLQVGPYVEELIRGLRARAQRGVAPGSTHFTTIKGSKP